MQSKGQGLTASLLMFVPLLAVPFLAVWGVPWLAAKSKTGEPDPSEYLTGDLLDAGVGQSQSGRHRSADLFAPVDEAPVVDLKLAPTSDIFEKPQAADQNPHLRNVSLVVSHEKAWTDPFDEIDTDPAISRHTPRQAANTPNVAPQKAVEPPGDEGIYAETPAPRVFEEPVVPQNAPPARNPFAEFEPRRAGSDRFDVNPNNAVQPPPEAIASQDPNAPRTLFGQNKSPMELVPEPPAQSVAPSAPPETKAVPAQPKAEPLTWDSARDRLKALGITHFYLQPDPNGKLYHFRCAYNPGGDTRINRLFEAEAEEPLEAVQKVLNQVESWTSRMN